MATKRVIVEIRIPRGITTEAAFSLASKDVEIPGFVIDKDYSPVPAPARRDLMADLAEANEEIVIIRGTIEEEHEDALKANPRVVAVWSDPQIEPFDAAGDRTKPHKLSLSPEASTSPCSPYDCAYTVAKGNLSDVAEYIGADWIWGKGYRGKGIVIGICDTGVHKSEIPSLKGGWSPPGALPWGDDTAHYHGTMCATDAMGICPDAKILDIGILKSVGIPALLSNAIAAYDWVISRYRANKEPHILSNSWGIYQEDWGPDYAQDPNHPFTRKVVEAIKEGILVCFAAGNCGEVCPDGRCGSDSGPGKSIWGANGHPKVITVGAANIRGQWIGYTSQGPAALDKMKPDICAPSHFKGYTASDAGTSAACPIAAGLLGLLRCRTPNLTQSRAKETLERTALDICQKGWDAQSGWGIVRGKAAYLKMTGERDEEPPPNGCCFIATAAYGSPSAPQVQRLRRIRDKRLSRSMLGRVAVDKFEAVYYTFSPTVAKAMTRNRALRSLIRRVLVTPIVVGLKLVFDRG